MTRIWKQLEIQTSALDMESLRDARLEAGMDA